MARQIGLRDIHIAILKTDFTYKQSKTAWAKVVKGVLIENKDDMPPTLALGFKSKKNNGKYRYVWLLKGKFELATYEYDTEAEKPKAQSTKLKGKFYYRDFDGNYRLICDEDAEEVDATIISSWFTVVPEQPVETP
jgi:phi13 family phage major tail protein